VAPGGVRRTNIRGIKTAVEPQVAGQYTGGVRQTNIRGIKMEGTNNRSSARARTLRS
jgi:hypothetical protein